MVEGVRRQATDELVASALARNADIRVAVARIEENGCQPARGEPRSCRKSIWAQRLAQRISTTTATPPAAERRSSAIIVRLALNTAFEIDSGENSGGRWRRRAHWHLARAMQRRGHAVAGGPHDAGVLLAALTGPAACIHALNARQSRRRAGPGAPGGQPAALPPIWS